MSYYRKHVFICTNQREGDKPCCANNNSKELLEYAKLKIKLLGENGKDKVRINLSGCLDRCSLGPVLVIYPDGVWYHYKNKMDIDEIIEEHVLNGRVVSRLMLEDN